MNLSCPTPHVARSWDPRVWPNGAWEVYTPSAVPCGGKPVECGTADDQGEGYDEARAALVRLCDRLRDHAERTSNSKSGGPL